MLLQPASMRPSSMNLFFPFSNCIALSSVKTVSMLLPGTLVAKSVGMYSLMAIFLCSVESQPI